MKETILITGANSFIATHLIPMLEKKYAVKLLTRNPVAPNEYGWNIEDGFIDDGALSGVNYIIHLAGAKLNDGTALTEERKRLIYESRIGGANLLRQKLQQRNQRIKSFVSASAIGYYGYQDDELAIDENGMKGFGFSADLCEDWEKAADTFKKENVADHVAKIRVSLVLGNDGGIFPIYKNLVTQQPAIAQQPNEGYFPWNHIDDMAAIFAYAVEHLLDGVYNSVSPQPASAQDIFKAIANELTDAHYTIQPFTGKHLVSDKIIKAGYTFKYPAIKDAVRNLCSA